MAKLTEEMVRAMAIDVGCGPHFVELCKKLFFQENARFLLEVIRYKRNPTFASAFAIYDEYIDKNGSSWVNLPTDIYGAIEAYLRPWKGVRQGTTGGRLFGLQYNHGRGTANVNLFNDAFKNILYLVSSQSDPGFQKGLENLIKSFELERRAVSA